MDRPDPHDRPAYVLVAAGLGLTTLFSLFLLLALAPSGLPAHIVCWRYQPNLIALHLAGDLLTWAAYSAIPFLALYMMARGRINGASRLTFPGLIGWGALFVWSCGQTHLLDALEIWYQVQWTRGALKLATGVISWVFVARLFRHRLRLITLARAIYRAGMEEGEGAE